MRTQNGGILTVILWLFVLVIGGIIAIRVIPAYIEFYAVNTSVKSIVNDPLEATQSHDTILLDLKKRLNINNVKHVHDKDIHITETNGHLSITVHYHVKAPLFSRFSLVMDFTAHAPEGA
ncbi:MAG: DUF4845 domain-containing protein [Pseudomonadota bacterium]|nr:DUF4845 domain-containing protein [Pseudomonadota bacterium]